MPILLPILAATVITNVASLMSALRTNARGTPFDITAELVIDKPEHTSVTIISDSSGSGSIHDVSPEWEGFRAAGEIIRARGVITPNWFDLTVAECQAIELLSRKPPRPPVDATTAELQSGRHDYSVIRTKGIVKEVFIDEIDPTWTYCSIISDGVSIYAACSSRIIRYESVKALVDAEVSVVGVCQARDDGMRRLIGRLILLPDANAFSVIRKPPADPFAAILIEPSEISGPADVMALGRRKVLGRTIAVLDGGDALVIDNAGSVHRIRFAENAPPSYGDDVEIVGTPETDLYRINFSNAIWRRLDRSIPYDDRAVDITADQILADSGGTRKIDPRFHGRAIRLAGKIVDLPSAGSRRGTIALKCGEFTVPVDIGANHDLIDSLSVGCVVSVAGTCVVETENWRPYAAFPHTTGITLVVRTPADVVILSRPSWWTPQRLMVVVGILLLVLVAIFIWNRILQRVIDRKSRQLLKEQVAQIKSELRVDERTHLAVELHDTLSQNLSGVACQIAATKGTLPEGADETARYLETAERMLLSCRTELRRCLWDLRGDTLEETNFTEAIRKTLAPVAIGVETIIRFNVPRSRLSDTTAHAVLCIIRELVANAIRHGKARTVRVAGEFHDGVLSFSVRDDGRGFDPSNCNGPAEGHFGLEGIRERIKHLDGTFAITSEIGKGTRAEVTLASIQPKDEKPEA